MWAKHSRCHHPIKCLTSLLDHYLCQGQNLLDVSGGFVSPTSSQSSYWTRWTAIRVRLIRHVLELPKIGWKLTILNAGTEWPQVQYFWFFDFYSSPKHSSFYRIHTLRHSRVLAWNLNWSWFLVTVLFGSFKGFAWKTLVVLWPSTFGPVLSYLIGTSLHFRKRGLLQAYTSCDAWA